jgi:lipopolysaccharide export system permease protein
VDWYLAREFLRGVVVVVVLFYVLGLVIVLFDEIDTFLEKKAPFLVALEFVVRSAPYRLAESGPLVMLLAAVFSIGGLVYRREIDAMVIGGYRLRRLLLPLVFVSSLCAIAFYFACEYIISPSQVRAENLMYVTIRGRDSREVWMWGQNRRKYFVKSFEPTTHRLVGVDVIEMAEDGFRPARRIKAREAQWNAGSGVWLMRDGTEWTFSPQGEVRVQTFTERSYLVEEGPEDFSLVSQDEKVLSHADLSHLVRVIRQAGGDPIAYLPHLRLREALPFSLIIMGMLGVGLAIRTGRGGYVLGLGISVLVALSFYAVLLFCHSCAKKGILPAGVAAWVPNVLFGCAMIVQLRELDRAT